MGQVTFKMDDSPGTITPMSEACISPDSGGTWCYGWFSTGLAPPMKFCYSNYLQNTLYHSSTTKMAGGTDKGYANAGDVFESNITAGFAYTCSAYYATYKN